MATVRPATPPPRRPGGPIQENGVDADPAFGVGLPGGFPTVAAARHLGPKESSLIVLVTPEEAAEALRIGRTRMYALLREGAIRSVRIGQSRRVPVQALHDFVAALEAEEPSHAPPPAGVTDGPYDSPGDRGHPTAREGR